MRIARLRWLVMLELGLTVRQTYAKIED